MSLHLSLQYFSRTFARKIEVKHFLTCVSNFHLISFFINFSIICLVKFFPTVTLVRRTDTTCKVHACMKPYFL